MLGDKDALIPGACWPIGLKMYLCYVLIMCVCLCACMCTWVHCPWSAEESVRSPGGNCELPIMGIRVLCRTVTLSHLSSPAGSLTQNPVRDPVPKIIYNNNNNNNNVEKQLRKTSQHQPLPTHWRVQLHMLVRGVGDRRKKISWRILVTPRCVIQSPKAFSLQRQRGHRQS